MSADASAAAPPAQDALARLRAGTPVFGIVQTLPIPQITELAAWSGFDFVILDCEHGVVDEPAQLACLAAASGHDLIMAVRTRRGDLAAVGRYADWGADAILMPDLCTAGEAGAFVAAAMPGPGGTRSSVSAARANRYGIGSATADARPLLLAIIESASGVDQADEIAASGIDGVLIGPGDLSADLGCPGDFAAGAYQAAFERVERIATARRLILGSRVHPPFDAGRLIAGGHAFILAAGDVAILAAGLRSACHEVAPARAARQ